MIAHLRGRLFSKRPGQAIVEAAGVGYDVTISVPTFTALPAEGAEVSLHIHTQVREDLLALFGFLELQEKRLFERLITVSGVGPKSALAILDVAKLDELSAAIKEDRPDLLTRASGIGRKTAERVIIELRTKVQSAKSGSMVEKMETDADLVEALSSLGYRREEARAALGKVDVKIVGVEARLKAALAILGKK